ncbi:hypothetical protein R1sor_016326 [Riccia sorocarpa]|uniref:Uncharacterized protein n=1 Tax=Riccia sorocarpa TaxID=122646 RepID=A0ABD3HEP2_9MARC
MNRWKPWKPKGAVAVLFGKKQVGRKISCPQEHFLNMGRIKTTSTTRKSAHNGGLESSSAVGNLSIGSRWEDSKGELTDTSEEQPEGELTYRPVDIITYRVGQGKKVRAKREIFPKGSRELAQLKWKNGCAFLEASNGQIRDMLTRDSGEVADKLRKWSGIAELEIPDSTSFGPDEMVQKMQQKQVEDTYHVFWSCPKAQRTWKSVEKLVELVTKHGRRGRPKCNHILLAKQPPK